ncbi:MAG: AAA family ATPase [Promethearchaeota archaeon]|nr:MAG: AAA family ATPase [Candidatus Lokiarchaeota archaeon]
MSKSEKKSAIQYIQQNDEFDYLKNLIKSMERGKSIGILLYGPPGTGKTLLSITLAKSLKAPYFFIDGTPDLDRRDLEGNWELINGETRFNYGPLTMAIKKANEEGIAFIIINEINAIRESEQISLNSLLSENHINLISKAFERHTLNSDAKLIIMGTMNKGVIGINKLQESFEDRFIVSLEINYPSRRKEVNIATKIVDCDQKVAEIVVDAARQIRKQALEDFTITKIFSTRLVVNFCLLLTKMPSKYLKNNIKSVIINKLGETIEERKSIAMILDGKLFENKLKNILEPPQTNSQKPENSPKIIKHDPSIQILKRAVSEYKNYYRSRNIFRKNGEVMWKFLDWLWKHEKRNLKNYLRLTEKLGYHEEYKRATHKSHLYRNEITLRYIKWLYRHKNMDLVIFMKRIHPIL